VTRARIAKRERPERLSQARKMRTREGLLWQQKPRPSAQVERSNVYRAEISRAARLEGALWENASRAPPYSAGEGAHRPHRASKRIRAQHTVQPPFFCGTGSLPNSSALISLATPRGASLLFPVMS
jgi:hypothetical protein